MLFRVNVRFPGIPTVDLTVFFSYSHELTSLHVMHYSKAWLGCATILVMKPSSSVFNHLDE